MSVNKKTLLSYDDLSDEQKSLVDEAKSGKNIICDACWGSGKTSTLITLYKELESTSATILYLTYNKELKVEARKGFNSKSNNIHNYDAFAWQLLTKHHRVAPLNSSDVIVEPDNIDLIPAYDIVLIDEYQDININHSKIIEQLFIKNENTQFIVVGDIDQKIGNKCNLNVRQFFTSLFEKSHREHTFLSLSRSFRLSPRLAELTGNIFGKTVQGENSNLEIDFIDMQDSDKLFSELSNYEPGQILILGGNYGNAKKIQNELEKRYPKKFNKNTLYSSVSEKDSDVRLNRQHDNICLDITYDTCKGLERDVVVLCDFNETYWNSRLSHTDYGIIKNLFGVAITRAKKRLIFVSDDKGLLMPSTIKDETQKSNYHTQPEISVSDVIQYKPNNLIHDAYDCLNIERINDAHGTIDVSKNDGLIDTSFIMGHYVEASYFKNYSVDRVINLFNATHTDYEIKLKPNASVLTKLKRLASAETHQNRYSDAKINISKSTKEKIFHRFNSEFPSDYNAIQIPLSMKSNGIKIQGIADAEKGNLIYEFKFVSQLQDINFIQCALYSVMSDKSAGILWNLQDDSKYSITVKDRNKFLNCISELVRYCGDSVITHTSDVELPNKLSYYLTTDKIKTKPEVSACINPDEKFAVIDIETAFNNKDVMSIGLVISNQQYDILSEKYYINKYINNGIFNSKKYEVEADMCTSYSDIISEIKNELSRHSVKKIFGYNAPFDKKRLVELWNYEWFDIMSKVKNSVIDENFAILTQKGKPSHSAESIYRQLYKDGKYTERHIAICDAKDELRIMQALDVKLNEYLQII